MSDSSHTNPDPQGSSDQPSPETTIDLATLIRCAADDNLSMTQADALRGHLAAHPEDQARIDFERALRDAVTSAMRTSPAPARLRANIEKMFAEHTTPATLGAATLGPRTTRNQSFWRRSVLPIAVAAMVLMAFGVTLMVSNQRQQNEGWNDGLSQRVVSWVQTEHKKCCDSVEYRQNKLRFTNVADAKEQFRLDIGAVPPRIQLDDAGYTFAGYGPCQIPGGGPSGQLVYTPNNGQGEPISLFVQRDEGQLDGVATKADCLTADGVLIWRADGLIYYLVTEPGKQTPETLRTLGVPKNLISL